VDDRSAGESSVTRALRFVVERLAEDPRASRLGLVDEAARRFDLSPLEAERLFRLLTDAGPRSTGGDGPPG
jgi:hypothetical protein